MDIIELENKSMNFHWLSMKSRKLFIERQWKFIDLYSNSMISIAFWWRSMRIFLSDLIDRKAALDIYSTRFKRTITQQSLLVRFVISSVERAFVTKWAYRTQFFTIPEHNPRHFSKRIRFSTVESQGKREKDDKHWNFAKFHRTNSDRKKVFEIVRK